MASSHKAHHSIASILAVLAAFASFFPRTPILQLGLAVFAIVFGAIGFLLSFLPRERGGCLSMFAMIVGIIGALAGIVRAIMNLQQQM